jgi:hypothetical protein
VKVLAAMALAVLGCGRDTPPRPTPTPTPTPPPVDPADVYEVHVVDAAGAPLADVDVRLDYHSHAGSGVFTTSLIAEMPTNAAGVARFAFPPGRYEHPEQITSTARRRDWPAVVGTNRIVLGPPHTVTGTLTLARGCAPAGVTIKAWPLWPALATYGAATGEELRGTVAADGTVTLAGVGAGTYRVHAEGCSTVDLVERPLVGGPPLVLDLVPN